MSKEKVGVGIPNSYRKDANQKADVLWKVKIKGRKFLVDDIPLHMSLRVFDYLDKEDMSEVKEKVRELKLRTPDPKRLTFKTTKFHSRHTHVDYYMLKVSGLHESCESFFNHFKHGYGFSHDKFMGHITIDKDLYDKINRDGLEPDEIEFSALSIEIGANNSVYEFDHKESAEEMDKMEKGLKHAAAGLAIATGLAGSPAKADSPEFKVPAVQMSAPAQSKIPDSIARPDTYSSERMANTIRSVESQKGKLQNHKELQRGPDAGEHAFGEYGLTPSVIRETIHMNPKLKAHRKALALRGNDLRRYMQDNPHLQNDIAMMHIKRLEHHFGQDPAKIGYAWINGITGTNKAMQQKADINNHWHVLKIKDAYGKEK
jgi:2'-5' RNA ligase